ncbi:MAG TPA: di-heme oxidoredictase family protein [Kofleriaceae bacterium]|nr:di-heme oxidoredictase family protein [Kofleriaceae bacterium]
MSGGGLARAALVAGLAAAACDGPLPATIDRAALDEVLTVPDERELQAELDDALTLKRREDLERAVDALEPGEQLSHATLSQVALDRGIFGPADLFTAGDDLFAYGFRTEQGLGNGLAGRPGIDAGPLPAPNSRRVHAGAFGGPDSHACIDCHFVGGDDGAGSLTQNAYLAGDGDSTLGADSRNPPALLGIGPVARLAEEMTDELTAERADALGRAAAGGADVTVDLTTKGVAFGALTAHADGTVDTAAVAGVSPDLVVRPFGWKGHALLRDSVKEAFRIHLGLVSMADQQAVRDGRAPAARYGDGPWYDVDRDGTTIEVDDGMVSTMVAYLSQLEVPLVQPPDDPDLLAAFARGRTVFDQVQCGSCHVPALRLVSPVLETRAEQTENTESPPVVVDVARDGMYPKVDAVDLPGSAFMVRLFSDLRRHDLGPGLAAPAPVDSPGGPIAPQVWLTRSLWGLADTAPYLHDGRAPTIADAILAHGGEAMAARNAFAALAPDDRAALLVYLSSLSRTRRAVIR